MFDRIEEGYENGQPLYVGNAHRNSSGRESVFRIMTEDAFVEMQQSDVQEILREQHIVITDKRQRKLSFEDALLDIAPLNTVTSIQGVLFGLFNYNNHLTRYMKI